MNRRIILVLLLIAYVVILINVMVLKNMPTIHIGHMMFRFAGTHEGAPNFMPFKTIGLYLRGGGGSLIASVNLLGNIGLLVPVGFLLPFVFPGMTWKNALLWAIASGFAIEGLQVLLRVGIFDIDDVILNGLGVLLGYGLQLLFVHLFHTIRSRALALAIAAVLMILAAIGVVAKMQGGREPVRPNGVIIK